MTVIELIQELTELMSSDESLGECPIHFQYNYGDYWKTQVAPEVDHVEESSVVYSGYHQMPKIHEEGGKSSDRKEITRVIVLRDLR